MSSTRKREPPSEPVALRTKQLHSVTGARIREERTRRRSTLHELARLAGLSVAMVQAIESGLPGSVDAYVRLTAALALRLEIDLVDPWSRRDQPLRLVATVHSAMREFEARRQSR